MYDLSQRASNSGTASSNYDLKVTKLGHEWLILICVLFSLVIPKMKAVETVSNGSYSLFADNCCSSEEFMCLQFDGLDDKFSIV